MSSDGGAVPPEMRWEELSRRSFTVTGFAIDPGGLAGGRFLDAIRLPKETASSMLAQAQGPLRRRKDARRGSRMPPGR